MISRAEPTEEAVAHIAFHMKDSDRIELADYGLGYDEMVHLPLWSKRPGTILWLAEDGEPVGVGGLDDESPWLFTTNRITQLRVSAHREAKALIAEWVEKKGRIWNYVSTENLDSCLWLHALGASFSIETYRFSPTGGTFRMFSWGE